LGVVLVMTWLLVMGTMFASQDHPQDAVDLDPSSLTHVLEQSDTWMGVYFHGRKLGFFHAQLGQRPPGFFYRQQAHLALRIAGKKQKINTRLSVRLDAGRAVEDFDFSVQAGELSVQVEGQVYDGGLRVELRLGKETIQRQWALARPPVFDFALTPLLARQDLSPGSRYRLPLFDPQTMRHRPVVVEVIGTEALATEGGLVPAIRIRRHLAGQQVDTWMDARGKVWQENYELGLSMRLESEATARAGMADLATIDIGQDMGEIMRLLAPGLSAERKQP